MGIYMIELAINALEAALYYHIVSHCLRLKYSNSRKYILWATHFLVTDLCNVFISNITLAITISLLTDIMLAFVFARNAYYEKIFWGTCFTLLARFSEYIVLLFSDWMMGNAIEAIMEFSATRYLWASVYLLLLTTLTFMVVHLKKRSLFFPKPVLLAFLFLVFIGIFSIETLIMNIATLGNAADSKTLISLHFVGFSFLAILVLLFILITFIGVLYRRNLALQKISAQRKLEKTQYQMLSDTNKVLRAWKHEYLNHLQTITGLLETDHYKECDKYAKELIDEIHLGTNSICTGNCVIDAMFSMKQLEAMEAGIRFTHELYIPETGHLPINDVLLSSLLGNMLSNAIEASSVTKDAYISLTIKPAKSNLLIELKNSSAGQYQYNADHELVSTKEGGEHGIGLKRISDIAREAGGFCRLQPQPDSFLTTVVLPLEEMME